MENEEVKKNEKNDKIFFCKNCNFTCSYLSDWERHLTRRKHIFNKNIANTEIKESEKNEEIKKNREFNCEYCNKIYKSSAGLWKHKKKCYDKKTIGQTENKSETDNENENEEESEDESDHENKSNNQTTIPSELTDKQVISLLVQQNMKLVQDNNDFKSMVLEVIKNGTHNTTNTNTNTTTNSHNKTFNLNIFLNEQCKDAVNMSDFVDSLIIELSDLEKTGRTNFVEGISNLILKNLRALDRNKRPIHCSDLKRETLYIKDNNKWERESDDKLRFKNIIRGIANENIKKIDDWTKKYPDCRLADSRKNDLYLNIVMNSMCGGSHEETQKNLNDIIRNIAKEVVIQK